MKRVLFVDDEPRVLDGIENVMFDHMDTWDVFRANDGQQALQMMATHAFDVLVTDMQMPQMGGEELLERARALYPWMICFVLSGHAKTTAMLKALSLAHRYLSKPCHADALLGALKSAAELIDLTHVQAVQDQLNKLHSLPPSPRLFLSLQSLIRQEAADFKNVAALIESDAVIAARILQVSNTAFFSRGRPCTSIPEAVSRLGFSTIESILLGLEVSQAFSTAHATLVEQLHRKFMRVGCLARVIAKEGENPDLAFMGGMLAGVGQLVLLCADPAQYAPLLLLPERQSLVEAEGAIYGANHTQVGAYVLNLWGLDLELIDLVAKQAEGVLYERAHLPQGWAVWMAQMLVEEADQADHKGDRERGALAARHDVLWEGVVEGEDVERWRAQLAQWQNLEEGA